MRKWLVIVFVMVLALAIAACGSNSDGNSNGTGGGQTQQGGSGSGSGDSENGGNVDAFAAGKYDPPITLTTVMGLNDNAAIFKEGETVEDNIHTRMIKERLGIDIQYDWVVTNTNDAYKTKLRLELSSGSKMPDVVSYRGDLETVNLLIDSGQFMAVDELVEKYAGEEYKKGLDLDPTIWFPISRDGKKMALPIFDYAYNADQVLWVRQDWLDDVGMDAPATLDEMEAVMEAFQKRDPNSYGLATGFINGFSNWMTDIGFVFGAYGAVPGQWNLVDDELVHGSIDPRAKLGLERLREWMEKGYISQDSALWDEVTGSELFTSGQAGMMVGPNWLPEWPFGDLEANDPNAVYKAYPLPAGPEGHSGTNGGNPAVNGYLFINKDAAHPEAVLMYYNWYFDNLANPQPGSEFEHGFAEGYDYALLPDGTPTTDVAAYPELFPGNVNDELVPPLYYTLTYEGARIPTLYAEVMVRLADGHEPVTPIEMREATRKDEGKHAMKVVMAQKDNQYKNYYTGPLTETMQDKNELLNTLLNENYNRIIYDRADMSEFDTMVQDWLNSGGDQITKEVNEWYDSVK